MQILLYSISKDKNFQNPVMVLVFSGRLMLINNPVKFNQDILNGSKVIERTQLE